MTTTQAHLASEYPLDPADIAHFAEHGFVKLPAVISTGTIAAYEPEITGTVVELNTQHLPLTERDTYGKAFLQVENLWRHSEVVSAFVHSRRLARIAAELLGVQGVRLYHDQALYKESGGGITPWHADQQYWPLATDRAVTAWIPLQETPAEMGPLAFAAGSHRHDLGRDLPISDGSERAVQAALTERGFPVVETPYALGEVSFHLGWTFHHAAANHSGTARRVMTVIYIDADMPVAEPRNDFQRADLESWLPGARPGEVPDTPLNPVLYRAAA